MTKFTSSIKDIENKVLASERLEKDELSYLFKNVSLLNLAYLANISRQYKVNDTQPVSFVVDRNINYTNICSCQCKICAFYKEEKDNGAYVLTYEQIKKKIQELVNINGTQLLLQGGLNKSLPLEYYVNMLKCIRKDFPDISLHAFSPPEIAFISGQNNLSFMQTIKLLKDAGLSSIPGGGAEILVDEVRNQIAPNKINSRTWLDVMEQAHKLGLKSSATMMFGSVETPEHIIEHLLKIRTLQDKTGGFLAFIPWTFQPNNTKINPDRIISGQDYLKVLAISRLALDNFRNIQVSWPTQGVKVAQVALGFGANDFGGIMMEENVIASTGLKINSSVQKVVSAIKAIKRTPAQRDTHYNILRVYQE